MEKKQIILNLTKKEEVELLYTEIKKLTHPFDFYLTLTLASEADYKRIERAFTSKDCPFDLDNSLSKSEFFQEAQFLSKESALGKKPPSSNFFELFGSDAPDNIFKNYKDAQSSQNIIWDKFLDESLINDKKDEKDFYDKFQYNVDIYNKKTKPMKERPIQERAQPRKFDKQPEKFEKQPEKFEKQKISAATKNFEKKNQKYSNPKGHSDPRNNGNAGEAEKNYVKKFMGRLNKSTDEPPSELEFLDDEKTNRLLQNGLPDKRNLVASSSKGKEFALLREHALFLFKFKYEELIKKAEASNCLIKLSENPNSLEIKGSPEGASSLADQIYKIISPFEFAKIRMEADFLTRNSLENLTLFKRIRHQLKVEIEILYELNDEEKHLVIYGEKDNLFKAKNELSDMKLEYFLWKDLISSSLGQDPGRKPDKKASLYFNNMGNILGLFFNNTLNIYTLRQEAKQLKVNFFQSDFKRTPNESASMLTFTIKKSASREFQELKNKINQMAANVVIIELERETKTDSLEKELSDFRQKLKETQSGNSQILIEAQGAEEKINVFIASEINQINSIPPLLGRLEILLENSWSARIFSLSFPDSLEKFNTIRQTFQKYDLQYRKRCVLQTLSKRLKGHPDPAESMVEVINKFFVPRKVEQNQEGPKNSGKRNIPRTSNERKEITNYANRKPQRPPESNSIATSSILVNDSDFDPEKAEPNRKPLFNKTKPQQKKKIEALSISLSSSEGNDSPMATGNRKDMLNLQEEIGFNKLETAQEDSSLHEKVPAKKTVNLLDGSFEEDKGSETASKQEERGREKIFPPAMNESKQDPVPLLEKDLDNSNNEAGTDATHNKSEFDDTIIRNEDLSSLQESPRKGNEQMREKELAASHPQEKIIENAELGASKQRLSPEIIANYLVKTFESDFKDAEFSNKQGILELKEDDKIFVMLLELLEAEGLWKKGASSIRQIFDLELWKNFETWHSFSQEHDLKITAHVLPCELNSHAPDTQLVRLSQFFKTNAKGVFLRNNKSLQQLLLDSEDQSSIQILICLFTGSLMDKSSCYIDLPCSENPPVYPCFFVTL